MKKLTLSEKLQRTHHQDFHKARVLQFSHHVRAVLVQMGITYSKKYTTIGKKSGRVKFWQIRYEDKNGRWTEKAINIDVLRKAIMQYPWAEKVVIADTVMTGYDFASGDSLFVYIKLATPEGK